MNRLESVLCKRCGRKLKTKASIDLGMGITCFKKYQNENNHKKLWKEKENKNEGTEQNGDSSSTL